MSTNGREAFRRLGLATGLALCTALWAAPVMAEDPAITTLDEGASAGVATLQLLATVDHAAVAGWDGIFTGQGVDWAVLVPDPDAVHLETDAGTTLSGLEWTRVVVTDPSGVEWTRLTAGQTDGPSLVQTTAAHPSGVEWTFLSCRDVDGFEWVASRFVDGDGRTWSRWAPGTDLTGVEWT